MRGCQISIGDSKRRNRAMNRAIMARFQDGGIRDPSTGPSRSIVPAHPFVDAAGEPSSVPRAPAPGLGAEEK